MITLSDYGAHFREAYAVLHGGRGVEPVDVGQRQPGESLEEFLARSRGQALGRVQRQLSAIEPPQALGKAHDILLRLLAGAVGADVALAAQVEAYRCGQFQESIGHSDRLQALVAESARLDRELILTLRGVESKRPGTLAELGVGDIVSSPGMG